MKIGIIGAGRVGLAFSKYLLADGHEVLLSNSRGPESLAAEVSALGAGARAVSREEAAAAAVVALAVPWVKVEEALRGLPAWSGRILIDTTNPFVEVNGTLQIKDLGGRGASEIVQDFAPGALVVKALNNFFMSRFEQGPRAGGGKRISFVSGDEADVKRKIGALLAGFGFAVIDLGSLKDGGRIQQAGGPLAGLDLTIQDAG